MKQSKLEKKVEKGISPRAKSVYETIRYLLQDLITYAIRGSPLFSYRFKGRK